MPYPSNTLLDHIRGEVSWVAEEFEYLTAQTKEFLAVEHKDNGTHRNITATSVTGGSGAFTTLAVSGASSLSTLAVSGASALTDLSVLNGLTERGRTTKVGEWITPTFAAGNFTASGTMAWTVAAGDVVTYRYTLVGKTMTLAWALNPTTIVAPVAGVLRLAIPGGYVSAASMTSLYVYSNAAPGVYAVGFADVYAASTYVSLYNNTYGIGNWAAGVDSTAVYGQLTFEIQ